jgi:tetratricopeptide (TPR) repeat protein
LPRESRSRAGTLKAAARAAGLTLRDLAARLGVSEATIYSYSCGRTRIPFDRVRMVAELTGWRPPAAVDLVGVVEHLEALLAQPDPSRALRFADGCLEAGGATPLERAKILRLSGNALLYRGDYREACQRLELGLAAARSVEDATLIAACSQSVGYCNTNLGRLDQARSAFEVALAHFDDGSKWKADVSLAALDEREGSFQDAEERLGRLAMQDGGSEHADAYILANQASLAAARGVWREALELSLRAYDLASRQGLTDQACELLLLAALAKFKTGAYEEASLLLIRGTDLARTHGDAARETLADLIWSWLLLSVNDRRGARAQTAAAHAKASRNGYRRSEAIGLLQMAEIAFARQDFEQCCDYATQTKAFCDTHCYYTYGVLAGLEKARAMLAIHDWEGVRNELEALGSDPRFATLGEARALRCSVGARLAWVEEDVETALALSRESIQLSEAVGTSIVTMRERAWLAGCLQKLDRPGDALSVRLEAATSLTSLQQQSLFFLDGARVERAKPTL